MLGGQVQFPSPRQGAWKMFGTEDQTFWCCTGSGVEEFSKLNDSIYWRDGRGLYVNLFVPSVLEWRSLSGLMAIRLRIPRWLQSAPTIKLNGSALHASAEPGSYLNLNREWKPGDKIEKRLPMHLRAEAMPDDRRLQAFLYGPLVLVGDLGAQGLTDAHITGPNLRVGAPNIE